MGGYQAHDDLPHVTMPSAHPTSTTGDSSAPADAGVNDVSNSFTTRIAVARALIIAGMVGFTTALIGIAIVGVVRWRL